MALLFQIRQKLSQGFSVLWSRYPNKSAKRDAEKAYGQVVKTPEIDAEVHEALNWQIPQWETMDWYHPPYLATYLRKERFKDPKPEVKSMMTRNPATGRPVTQEQVTQTVAVSKIQQLMREGMSPEEAKRTVYLELGWIRE